MPPVAKDYLEMLAHHLDQLPPYTPIEPFEVLSARYGRTPDQIVKLDANENPYGMAPAAREALEQLQYPHIYPDPESRALRQALSKFTGVPASHLLAGSGADELIDLLLRVLIEPGDRVLTCPPTFGMYAFDTRLNAGQVVEVARRPDFSIDLEQIRAAVKRDKPKLIFLANPNNPDGSMLENGEIEALLDLPALLVLDEAYIEFSSLDISDVTTRIDRVPEQANLVVLRTFSKWAGLAGLRVGYGAFPAWLMPALWKAKQPYNLNVAASAAALASLSDLDYLQANLTAIQIQRQELYESLSAIPYLQPYPSRANFIICKVTGGDAEALKHDLAYQHGILVRYFNTPSLRDHIRISVGRPADTSKLIDALANWQANRNS
jgi:histidinol-phosphate aminotransferase